MKLIKLTQRHMNKPIYINPDSIEYMYESEDNEFTTVGVTDKSFQVTETVKQIIKAFTARGYSSDVVIDVDILKK